MNKFFWIGLSGLVLYEIMNVYFIMPLPGSQEMNCVGLAYFFYGWRWVFRALLVLMVIVGIRSAFRAKRKWIPFFALLFVTAIVYGINSGMSAERMFLQPRNIIMAT